MYYITTSALQKTMPYFQILCYLKIESEIRDNESTHNPKEKYYV